MTALTLISHLVGALLLLVFAACSSVSTSVPVPEGQPIEVTVIAEIETKPVPHSGDAADDVAVWVHPTDPTLSLIIATDKQGGIATYDLDGEELSYYTVGRPNNIDVRKGFILSGKAIDIVVASDLESDTLLIYRVDPASRQLIDMRLAATATDFGVAGLCLYMNEGGRLFAFASDSSGLTKQYELFASGDQIGYRFVRKLDVGFVSEGCVANDQDGLLYLADEQGRIAMTPAGPDAVLSLDFIGGPETLTADVEGLALAGDLLLASSQGSDDFAVFDRRNGRYLGRFAIVSGSTDEVSHTDGIEVSTIDLGSKFPRGAFIAQDDENDFDNQNFKLVSWSLIAEAFASP